MPEEGFLKDKRGELMSKLTICEICTDESTLLESFLYYAIFVPPGAEAPPSEIIRKPEISVYIDDWGKLDDCGVFAKRDDVIVGMA
jgi:hypothetical protein